ncbi:5'-3' exoribonuclease 2 [Batrachochytrium dendrobatidis]|nr:5'-3' exoribonuclease 2 [Batrachochytrium dendrobatidis]
MGIPALFRWLSTKYPKVTSECIEDIPQSVGNTIVPVDTTLPNPNGTEYDNLYLDMNGIIHPCCHPEDKPAPTTEDEMYIEIFKYIDRIMAIIRPRKVLYMAIDGVAPRAKMNQQRSRRFRAAQEEQQKKDAEDRIRKQLMEDGHTQAETVKKAHFDSNCITPGTPFMDQLAICLRYYVAKKLSEDAGWNGLKVIISDASIPGEGEHKIMDYIRRQRNQPGYDAQTHHVLYGLDADLIMLALATHEPHFNILREDVFFKDGKQNGCFICGKVGHMAWQCTGKKADNANQIAEKTIATGEKPYIFLHVNVLREYLEVELSVPNLSFEWDFERAIDDWVFLCFFVGNDFLPHLPSLEIREGAIDQLIKLWKQYLDQWGGFLTDSGDLELKRVQELMIELGKVEDATFQKRREEEERRRQNRIRRKQDTKNRLEGHGRNNRAESHKRFPTDEPIEILEQMTDLEVLPVRGTDPKKRGDLNRKAVKIASGTKKENLAAAEVLRNRLAASKSATLSADNSSKPDQDAAVVSSKKSASGKKRTVDEAQALSESDKGDTSTKTQSISDHSSKRVAMDATLDGSDNPIETDEMEEIVVESTSVAAIPPKPVLVPVPVEAATPTAQVDSDDEAPADDVRLWESGWKQRYYRTKFQVELDDTSFREQVVTSYVEGLCWVLKYYYQGVQSWKWYYPYHYAPFSSDCDFIGRLDIKFELGTPFLPVEQLMGVLPAASMQHIPPPLRPLMTEPSSNIIDFYPVDFPIDLNGKKYSWQGVALLPFIDENRLLKAIVPIYNQFSEDEKRRNTLGHEIVVVGATHPLFDDFCGLYGHGGHTKMVPLDPVRSDKFFGFVEPEDTFTAPGSSFESPLEDLGMTAIESNNSLSAKYFMPVTPAGYKYLARLLPQVQFPKKVLDESDRHAVRVGYNSQRNGRRGGSVRINRGGAQRVTGMGPGNNGHNGGGYAHSRGGYNDRNSHRGGYQNGQPHRALHASNGSNGSEQPYMGGGGYGSYSDHGRNLSGNHGAAYTPSNYSYGNNQYESQSNYSNNPSRGGPPSYGNNGRSGSSRGGYSHHQQQEHGHGQHRNQYQQSNYGGGYAQQYPASEGQFGNNQPQQGAAIVTNLLNQLSGDSHGQHRPPQHEGYQNSWSSYEAPHNPASRGGHHPHSAQTSQHPAGNIGWNRNVSNGQRGRGSRGGRGSHRGQR